MTSGDKVQIAQLRGQGMGYTQIARELGLSVNTVKSYCQRSQLKRNNGSEKESTSGDVCRQCGSGLEHTPGRKKKQFCSDACRLGWWHAHRDMSRSARKVRCESCGKVFMTDRVQKYCSHGCYINVRFGGNINGRNADTEAV